MLTISPQTKKLLSAFAVTVAGAALVLVNAYVVKLPAELQGFAGAVLAGAVHFVNAWGSHERALDTVNKDIASGKVEAS